MTEENKENKAEDMKKRVEAATETQQFKTILRKIEKVAKVWDTFNSDMRENLNEVYGASENTLAASAFEQRVVEAGHWLGQLLEQTQQRALLQIIAEQGKAESDPQQVLKFEDEKSDD